MKNLGYMEGTDSVVLTTALTEGFETYPLSNGWDNHGKNLSHITTGDNLAAVIGYLHKFTVLFTHQTLEGLLSPLKACGVPLLVIVPKSQHEKAKAIFEIEGLNYKFVDPEDLMDEILKLPRD